MGAAVEGGAWSRAWPCVSGRTVGGDAGEGLLLEQNH